MKKLLLYLGSGLLAVGLQPALAIWVPQTRQEFVDAVAKGAGATKMERLLVERDFDEVYRVLEARCSPCLDKEVRRSGFVGGQMEVSSSDYNPTLKRSPRAGLNSRCRSCIDRAGSAPRLHPAGST